MSLNTAVAANVLLEKTTGELKAKPVTLHLVHRVTETLTQFRERIFALVEEHYQPTGRVVSLTIVEQAEVGKRAISMRRVTETSPELEWCESPKLDQHFRTGGEVVRLIPDPAPLH